MFGTGTLPEPLFDFHKNLNRNRYRYFLVVNYFLFRPIKKNRCIPKQGLGLKLKTPVLSPEPFKNIGTESLPVET